MIRGLGPEHEHHRTSVSCRGRSANPRPYDRLCGLLAAWPARPEEFQRRCQGISDWLVVLEQAERHGVLGILSRPLTDVTIQLAPAVRAHLEERRTVERLWSTRLTAAL